MLLWKGFPKELVEDHVLGATEAEGPQMAGAGGEGDAAKDTGWFQLGIAGLGPKTIGWAKPEG